MTTFGTPLSLYYHDLNRFLGVPYSSQPCSFPEIRGRLAKDSGNPKVTVPTLLLNDEEHKSESFKIAEYVSDLN